MKKLIYILTTAMFSALSITGFGGTWENYSNITQITDAKQVDGHIWISGKGGVIDFNTATADRTIFKLGDAGLPSSSVEQVAVNSVDGTIWVGTYDAGVVAWNGTSFITYAFPVAFNLYRMKFDGFGDLWLQTNSGLYKFDNTTHEYTFINSVGGAGWDFNAWDFDITPDNHVLIFTGTSCMVIDAATNAALDSFPNTESPLVLGCVPANVRVYEIDENTYLLSNGGVLEFERKDGTFISAMGGLPEFAYVGNIARGTDNKLYCLVDNGDIYLLDGTEWELVNHIDYISDKLFYTDGTDFLLNQYAYLQPPVLIRSSAVDIDMYSTREFGFNSNNITGVVANNTGDILAASATQIVMYNEMTNNWDAYLDVPTIYGSMYDLQYAANNLYVIDYGNLLEYYDGTTWNHIPYADGYTSEYIYDYCVSSTGVVYFVNDEGLFKYEDGETVILLTTSGDLTDWFLSIAYDESRNTIWLGKLEGIIKYDFVTEDVITNMELPALAEGPAIQCIEVDADNNIWFGANNNKAYKFDGEDWTDYNVGTGGDFIIDFAFSGTKVYFGLVDGTAGVYVLDNADNSWEFLNSTEDEGMLSNNVAQLAIDKNNNLWMAHHDLGISVFREETDPLTINSNQGTNAMNVFPNPAQNTITVDILMSADNLVRINDMNGREIFSKATDNSTIDISSLPSGIYLLKVYETTSGNTYVSKFMVEK